MLTKRQVRISALMITTLLAVVLLWYVRQALFPFAAALILAYILNPPVGYLEKKGIGRLWSILIVYFIAFSTLVYGISHLVPIVLKELEMFGQDLPLITEKVEQYVQSMQSSYQNSAMPYSLRLAIDNALIHTERNLQLFIDGLVSGIIGVVSHFIGWAISPVLAFYLLYDWNDIKKYIMFIVPSKWRCELGAVLKDVDQVLNGVIRGQVIIALLVGIFISTGLYFLRVKFAFSIGILAGILDIIPYFGAIIGAAPAVTLALLESPLLALKVTGLFFLVHQLEGTIIGPKILGESVGLHPLTVILSLLIGEELLGVTGMLIAVPIMAIGKVFICHAIKLLI